jgi:hypothetical protein
MYYFYVYLKIYNIYILIPYFNFIKRLPLNINDCDVPTIIYIIQKKSFTKFFALLNYIIWFIYKNKNSQIKKITYNIYNTLI